MGDAAAWRELVDAHIGIVHAICRAFGLDGQASGQVNQVVWLRLAEHLRRGGPLVGVGEWLAASARRECLLPRRAVQRSGWVTGGLSIRLGDGTDVERAMAAVALDRSFARLGARCQRLLRLSAAWPPPAAGVVAVALGESPEDVVAACGGCRERLEAMTRADAVGRGPADAGAALQGVIAAGDPVPASWWKAAEAAFGWLHIDTDLAEVVYSTLGRKDADGGGALADASGRTLS